MGIFRSVHARLIERFIFNFRLRPEALASILPVSYLKPQVFHGWSVVSFCLLRLDRVMLSPLPSFLNFKTISCAYRYGVIDTSGVKPVSSVYVPGRYTDLALISHLGPWVFSGTIPRIRSSLTQEGVSKAIRIDHFDQQCLFSAQVKPVPSPGTLDCIFDSLASFAHFIKAGVSSYTPAIDGKTLARVDLYKDNTSYGIMDGNIVHNSLDHLWPAGGLIFDSAIRATGGVYKWTYRGLVERNSYPIYPNLSIGTKR